LSHTITLQEIDLRVFSPAAMDARKHLSVFSSARDRLYPSNFAQKLKD